MNLRIFTSLTCTPLWAANESVNSMRFTGRLEINVKITEDVYQLDSTKQSHVFLIQSDENILIDTGMPGLTRKIISELESLSIASNSIKKILLTHHDVDHMGNAKELQDITNAEIWAPNEDIPYITGIKNRSGIKHLVQTVVRPKKPKVLHQYEKDHEVNGIRVIHAPGHTPGHSMLQYKNILFIGDLFKVIDGKPKLLPFFMNWDLNEVRKSISIINGLEYDWICPSHGEPIHNGNLMKEFLSKFN